MSGSVSLTSSAMPTYTEQAASPFLSSYANMSSDQLTQLSQEQASYRPQAPDANVAQAQNLLTTALNTQDPALQTALLQKVYDLITPNGGATPATLPQSLPFGTSQAGAASPGIGSTTGMQQTMANLQSAMANMQAELAGAGQAAPAAQSTPGAIPGVTPACMPSAPSGLSVNGNTVDTGRYSIAASAADDGSLTVTDKQTGKSFEVWGDPHVKENGQNVADFQKDNLDVQLQDGTTIHMQPGALQNGVSHLDQVSITKGNDAVTMGGTNGSFNQGVTTSGVMAGQATNQSALYDAPNATDLTFGADDMLHYDNNNGSMAGMVAAQGDGSQTNLDGVGGGLVGQPGTGGNSTGAASSDEATLMRQLDQSISSYTTGFQTTILQSLMSQLQNQSGFQAA